MSYDEERIVKLTFDNAQFERDVSHSLKTLQELEKAMNIKASTSNAFTTLAKSADQAKPSMDSYAASIDTVQAKFTALQVVGMTVLSELTKAAMSAGKSLWDNTIGQIISGGTKRSLNLENAQFKIEGLGASWADAYKNMDYAVSGTAYGLDEAAGVAAQLIASGVEYGRVLKDDVEQLTLMDAALRGVSGVAAMSGRSYEDVGHIFTTVAGNGRLFAMQLNQISAYGLNAAKALADYYNEVNNTSEYTEARIREMVTQGKISFADFAAAMDSAFGEHAKDANKTFQGAFSNMKAALSRIGEMFITPLHEFEKDVYNTIRPLLNVIKTRLAPVADWFTSLTEQASVLVEYIGQNEDFVYAIQYAVIDIEKVLASILRGVFEIFDLDFYSLGNTLTRIKEILRSLQLDAAGMEKVKNITKSVIGAIQMMISVVKALGIIVTPFLKATLTVLARIFKVNTNGYDVLYKMAPVVDRICTLAAEIIASKIEVFLANCNKYLGYVNTALKFVAVGLGVFIVVVAKAILKVRDFILYIWQFKDVALTVVEVVALGFIGLGTIIANTLDSIRGFMSSINTASNTFLGGLFDGVLSQQRTAISQQQEYTEAVEETAEAAQNVANVGSSGGNNDFSTKGAARPNSGKAGNAGTPNPAPIPVTPPQDISKAADDTADEMHKSGVKIRSASIEATNQITTGWTKLIKSIRAPVENKELTVFQKVKNFFKQSFISIAEVFVNVANSIKDWFSDPVRAIVTILGGIATVVVGSITGAIFNIVNGIGIAFLGIGASFLGSGIQSIMLGIASIFESMVPIILAFTALVAALAVIDRFSDLDKIYDFLDMVMNATIKIMQAVKVITIWKSIEKMYKSSWGAIDSVRKLLGGNFIDPVPTSTLEKVKDLFISISILMGTIVASVALLDKIGIEKYWPELLTVGGILALICTALIVLSKNMNDTMSVEDALNGNILKGGSFTKKTKSTFGGVNQFLLTLSFSLATIVGSIAALSLLAKNKETFNSALGAVIGIFVSVLALLTGIAFYTDAMMKSDKFDAKKALAINKTITALSSFLNSIGIMMLMFTASIAVLSLFEPSKLIASTITVGLMLAGVMTAIKILINAIEPAVNDKENTYKSFEGGKGSTYRDKLEARLIQVTKLVQAIGPMIAMFAGSIALLSLFKPEKIAVSTIALVGILLVVTWATTKIMDTAKTVSGQNNASGQRELDRLIPQISTMITSIGRLMLMLAGSLAITSLIPIDKMVASAGTLTLMFGALSLIMFLMFKGVAGITSGKGGITGAVKASKSAKKSGQSQTIDEANSRAVEDKVSKVMELIQTMGNCMLKLSVALAITSLIPTDKMVASATTMVLSFGAMMGIAYGMVWAISKYQIKDDALKNVQKMMVLVSGLMIALSAAFVLLGLVDWANVGTGTGFLVAAVGLITGILAISVIIAKVGTNSKALAASALIIATTSLLLMSIAELFLNLGDVDWSNASQSLGPMIAIMSGLTALMVAVAVMTGIGDVGNILAAGGVILTMSFMLTELTSFLKVVGSLNWGNASQSMGVLITVFAGLTAVVLAAGILGAISPTGVLAASVMMVALLPTLLGIGLMLKVIASIPIENSWERIGQLAVVFVSIAGFIALLGVIGTFLPGASLVIVALSALFVSIGVTMTLAATAGLIVAAAVLVLVGAFGLFAHFLNDFLNIDWSKAQVAGLGLATLVENITLPLIGLSFAIPAMLALAIGLPLLALGLTALSQLSGEQMTQIGIALGVLMESLQSVIQNGAGVGLIILFATGLTIASALLVVGSALLLASAALISVGGTLLIGALAVFNQAMSMLAEQINNGLLDNMQSMLMAAAWLTIIGVFLTTGGALLTAGGLLMTVGAALFLAGVTIFSIAMQTMLNIFAGDLPIQLLQNAAMISVFAIVLAISSGLLGITSLGFILSSTLFLAGAGIYKTGANLFNQGTTLLTGAVSMACAAVREMADTFQYCVESINTSVGSMIEAGQNIVLGVTEGMSDDTVLSSVQGAIGGVAGSIITTFRDALGIHSPSDVMAELGFYTIAGVLQGLEQGESLVEAATHEYVDENNAIVEDGIEQSGSTAGTSLFQSFIDAYNDSGFMGVIQQIGQSLGSGFTSKFGSTVGSGFTSIFDTISRRLSQQKEMVSSGNRELQALQTALAEAERKGDTSLAASISARIAASEAKIQTLGEMASFLDSLDLDKIFDDMDLDKLGGGGGGGGYSSADYSSMTPVSTGTDYGGVGGGTTFGNAVDTNNLMGNTITTNNTYNFTQNNYSPEPIDRTELYTQTNNQLNSWYKWLRTQ